MKKTNSSPCGTSFHGQSLLTSPKKLINLAKNLGADFSNNNTGEDKTNFDFVFETEKGDVFTVYDWKEYRILGLEDSVDWHIGAKSRDIALRARQELIQTLNK